MKVAAAIFGFVCILVIEVVTFTAGYQFVQNKEAASPPQKKVVLPKVYVNLTEEQVDELKELADRNFQKTEDVRQYSMINTVLLVVQISFKVILIVLALYILSQSAKVIAEGRANNTISGRYAELTASANNDFRRLLKSLEQQIQINAKAAVKTAENAAEQVTQKLEQISSAAKADVSTPPPTSP